MNRQPHESGHNERRGQRHCNGLPVGIVQFKEKKGADHSNGALGEVDDPRGSIDQDQALGRQGVHRPGPQAQQGELQWTHPVGPTT